MKTHHKVSFFRSSFFLTILLFLALTNIAWLPAGSSLPFSSNTDITNTLDYEAGEIPGDLKEAFIKTLIRYKNSTEPDRWVISNWEIKGDWAAGFASISNPKEEEVGVAVNLIAKFEPNLEGWRAITHIDSDWISWIEKSPNDLFSYRMKTYLKSQGFQNNNSDTRSAPTFYFPWLAGTKGTISRGHHDGYAVDFLIGKYPGSYSGDIVSSSADGKVFSSKWTGQAQCRCKAWSSGKCTGGWVYPSGHPKVGQSCPWTEANYVKIRHSDGSVTFYLHLAYNTIPADFKKNWATTPPVTIQHGEIVGREGSTGWSTGAHLHFGVYKSDSVAASNSKPFTIKNNTSFIKSSAMTSGSWTSANAPIAPTLKSPANNSTITNTNVLFSWNTASGASKYYLEYSGPVTGNSGWITGTNFSAVSLPPGIYTWRVQSMNSGGISRWSQSWKFTIQPAPPPAPILASPANNAITTQNITFTWNATIGAAEYYLEYSGAVSGNSDWITATSFTANSLPVGGYTWRVKARNAGGESPWSASWAFTVQPPAPTLELPLNDASTTSDISFTWNASNGATEYYLEYSGPSSGNSGWVNPTTFSVNALPVGTYTWQVKARNGSIESPWSQTRTFTVAPALPPAPTLSTPTNGVETEPDVIFTWNVATDATEYYLEYTGSASGNSDWISDTSYSVLSLPVGTYQWKVKARNSTGESSWSETWTITVKPTIVPPFAPTLISPADAENVSADLTFTWDAAAEATEYYAEYSGPSSGNSSWISSTSFSVTSLAVGTYEWQVKARNSAGESLWSAAWSFTVEPTIVPPAAPSLISPADTSNVNPDFTFTWNGVPDATEYFVEYLGAAIGDSGWISTASFPVTSLPIGSYTWGVKARNSAGESLWSETWAFNVEPIIVPPSAPALVYPAYTASVYPDFSFSWNSTADATEYYAEYSGASSGNSGWTSGTTFAVTSLLVGNYTWQVKARNSAGEGLWSQTWSFTVVPYPPAAPTLVSPTNGATIVGSSATFIWNGVSGAVDYYAEYSGPASGNSGWTTATTFSATSLAAGTYTWHVKARNAGGESSWSSSWTVIIQSPPTPIIIQATLTPAYGSTCTTAWYRVSGGYNSTYIYLTLNTNVSANSTNSGKWKPTIPLTGKYKIEAFIATHNPITWPCSPGGTIGWDTSDAKYQVYANGVKASTVKINQGPLENQWASLGTFTLTAGTNNYIILTDLNGETQWTKTISFNVMRFTWVSP